MRGLWGEVNTFFSYTSIHGFPYISDTQSRSTRKIWTIIVLVAFGVASNFLYQTIKGFDEKYVSTTIETQSIQKFPFPAITFHSGKYNSEKAFIRTFLNEFQFTRYNEGDVLRDNDEFGKLYKWLVSPTQYAQSCTGTLRSRHFQLIFIGKWKTTTHITIGKCMTIQFTTWF